MTVDPAAVYGAIAISALSCVIWGFLGVRVGWKLQKHAEHRPYIMAMPAVGFVASLGTLASAIGFGISSGTFEFFVSQQALTLMASMGRGALLMGGVIALAYYHPPKRS
jgi:hypothetical protein